MPIPPPSQAFMNAFAELCEEHDVCAAWVAIHDAAPEHTPSAPNTKSITISTGGLPAARVPTEAAIRESVATFERVMVAVANRLASDVAEA